MAESGWIHSGIPLTIGSQIIPPQSLRGAPGRFVFGSFGVGVDRSGPLVISKDIEGPSWGGGAGGWTDRINDAFMFDKLDKE